jgi:acetyltransferase-like isoleucine patch superfamily enzyme
MDLSLYSLLHSRNDFIKFIKSAYRWLQDVSLPLPYFLAKIFLVFYVICRSVIYFFRRVFVSEPLLKGYCKKYGKNVHADIYVHWINGKGDIILGDGVRLDGKSSIKFSSHYCKTPTLEVGNYTHIGHNATLTIGKCISIGKYCRISSDVFIFDYSGHPLDPVARKQGFSSAIEEVRPVTIEDNVWIGRRVIVLPGVTIGKGSVIAAGTVVTKDVPSYCVAAGNPARIVKDLKPIYSCED